MLAATTCSTVRWNASLRLNGFDHGLALAVEGPHRDPVADRGQLLFGKLSRWDAAHGALLREQLARPVVTRGDPRGNQVVCCVWLERVCEERVPAEVLQVQNELLWLDRQKSALFGRAR
jgi:hypothetical protein